MKQDKARFSNDIQIRNKKSSYEYEFIEKFEAGLVLKGTEIKSIREGRASIQEAHCFVSEGEAFIKGMNISPYAQASFSGHEINRVRKLLLKKKEIEKIRTRIEEKGLTIVPVRLFVSKRGFAKLEIAVARGKKLFDKRQDLKKKDQAREIKQMNS